MFDDKPLLYERLLFQRRERVYAATEALLAIPGISGNYAVSSDAREREGVVATVFVGIFGGAIAIVSVIEDLEFLPSRSIIGIP